MLKSSDCYYFMLNFLIIKWVGDWQVRCFSPEHCCGSAAEKVSNLVLLAVILLTPHKTEKIMSSQEEQ